MFLSFLYVTLKSKAIYQENATKSSNLGILQSFQTGTTIVGHRHEFTSLAFTRQSSMNYRTRS